MLCSFGGALARGRHNLADLAYLGGQVHPRCELGKTDSVTCKGPRKDDHLRSEPNMLAENVGWCHWMRSPHYSAAAEAKANRVLGALDTPCDRVEDTTREQLVHERQAHGCMQVV